MKNHILTGLLPLGYFITPGSRHLLLHVCLFLSLSPFAFAAENQPSSPAKPEFDMLVIMNGTGNVERFSPQGKHLGTLVRAIPSANGLALGPDNRLYVTTGQQGWPGSVLRFDTQTGRNLGPFINISPGNPGSLIRATTLAWNGQSLIVAGCDNGIVNSYDSKIGSYQAKLISGSAGGITQITIKDEHLFAADFQAQGIRQFNLKTGKDLGLILHRPGFHPWGVAADRSGTIYWSGSTNEIRAFNGKTDRPFASGPHFNTPIHLAIGPDGLLYAVNLGAGSIIAFDTKTGQIARTITSPAMSRPIGLTWVPATPNQADTKQIAQAGFKPDDLSFYTNQVLPILQTHCYKCHSHAVKIKGGLALDSRSGWETGGDSGPALIAGNPEESLLLTAVRHTDDSLRMPPDNKLSAQQINILTDWVRRGAPAPSPAKSADPWELAYQKRLAWWSFQPIANPPIPQVLDTKWPKTEIDHFLLNSLEKEHLIPAPSADRRTLARRLSFVLTGLPLAPHQVERFAADPDPSAFSRLVDQLLSSPHFGERWARHWMDVVHYSDTHGYEWDAPAKNAWMYRDYLTRAYNHDIPFNRLIMEQIAGDLIPPRIDHRTGINESILGPMAMRLGERRHGDNAAAEGISQEAMANIIDTTTKAFLGSTVACAQCHDHKFDPFGQSDYYALSGSFMSSRWGVRTANTTDPNLAVLKSLQSIKTDLKQALARQWLASRPALVASLKSIKPDAKITAFPESLTQLLQRHPIKPVTETEFLQEHQRRTQSNKTKLRLLADFTSPDSTSGWQWEGFGMQHGLAPDGAFAIAPEGNNALLHILPAGRWSHLYSMRLAGRLQSPLLKTFPPVTFSVGFAGGEKASQAFIVDNAFHSERMAFPNMPQPGWLTLKAGDFDRLSGPADQLPRRVYLELATKSLNNYFPPRTGYGGVKEAELTNPRSWFGVTRIYSHAPGQAPVDTLEFLKPLFTDLQEKHNADLAEKIADLVLDSIQRWSADHSTPADVTILNEAIQQKWLSNDIHANPQIERLVTLYRQQEQALEPDLTIGSTDDWHEGRNEFLAIRGSYTDFGDEVPRGTVRLLAPLASPVSSNSSGRLEFAQSVANPQNPLTARVYVNRVWMHLFGDGLVRTTDDFGHLGEQPSHPQLLDYLATRFMNEGWSTKQLIRLILHSAAWQQSGTPSPQAITKDPENRLLHHYSQRRLDAEALRDSLLAISGRLDPKLGGPPIDPHRSAQDSAKRLFSGPLDGLGRRSIYLKMTMMEPPRFLALFNQPIPKLTTGRRDRTNVPDQALALLNDPFVIAMANSWASHIVQGTNTSPADHIVMMFSKALGRPPSTDETNRLLALLNQLAELHQVQPQAISSSQAIWKDIAHTIFNLKEFLYVR